MDMACVSIGLNQLALLESIKDFDARDGWRNSGCKDTAAWLSARYGIRPFLARRMVTASKVISSLPYIRKALSDGRLDLERVVELTRIATPATEKDLIRWARRVTPATIRLRADQQRAKAARQAKRNDRTRYVTWDIDDFASVAWINVYMPTPQALQVIGAVDRVAKMLPADPDDPQPLDQLRADALVHICSAYMADHKDPERPTVVVHTTLDKLVSKTECSELHGGIALQPSVTRALCCDSRIQAVIKNPDGTTRAIGDPHYVVPGRLRRVVLHRDGHRCTFPGCHQRYMVDVHHVKPWPDGATEETNLVTVCRFHHNLIHIHSWKVNLSKDGITTWFRPNGDRYDPAPVRGSPVAID